MDVHDYIASVDREMVKLGASREVLFEVGGFTVYGYALENASSERSVYLSAGMHGDEPAGPLALLELLKEGAFAKRNSWYICPMLNPTGMALGTRENVDGLDLNRDYLAMSSREVKGHVEWLEGKHFDFAISLHEDWESTGFYFYEINQVEDRPQRYQRMVDAISPIMPMEPEELIDDHAIREKGWIYHESEADEPELWPEAIYLAKRGCPLSFTFETPSSLVLEKRVRAHKTAVCAALHLCFED